MRKVENCHKCLKPIENDRLHFYIQKKKVWYCYECYQEYRKNQKERNKNKNLKIDELVEIDLKRETRKLYKEGKKPSEIAKLLDISASEVYKKLS